MSLPEGVKLTYKQTREGGRPALAVNVVEKRTGAERFAFTVTEERGCDLRLGLSNEAWGAFKEVPGLFEALSPLTGTSSLRDVKSVLLELGAISRG
jgi:hypothetical protein